MPIYDAMRTEFVQIGYNWTRAHPRFGPNTARATEVSEDILREETSQWDVLRTATDVINKGEYPYGLFW